MILVLDKGLCNIKRILQLNEFQFKECQWLDVFSHNPQPDLPACHDHHHLKKKQINKVQY